MRKLMKIEFYKLWHTKRFWICVIAGIVIVSFNIFYFWEGWQQMLEARVRMQEEAANLDLPAFTLYNTWIGNEGYTFGTSIFYFVFPLLCCIPYGSSLNEDIQSGYLKNIAVRTEKKKYFQSKYICTFVSGGLAMTVPLLFNFIVNAMNIPALKPDMVYPYYAVTPATFLSELYCTYPLIFNIIYLIISFVFCGLIATMGFVCSYIIKNKAIVVLLPFGVLLVAHYIGTLLYDAKGGKYEWSPLYGIHPTPMRGYNTAWNIILYMAIMLGVTGIMIWRKGNRNYEIL